jgi:glycosyltransferase involved in cell wall biosynthesis
VAMVIPRYIPVFGGAENQCRALVRTFRQRGGVDVPFVLTSRISAELESLDSVDDTTVVRVGTPGTGRGASYGFYLHAFRELWRRRAEFDVVHCHATSVVGATATLLGTLVGRPVVLKLSTSDEFAPRGRGLRARYRRSLARFMGRRAHVVVLTAEGREEAERVRCRSLHVVPNGVDTETYRFPGQARRLELRRKLGIPADARVVLFSGRFVRRKGIDTFLAALRLLPEDARPLACLVGSSHLQEESQDAVIAASLAELGRGLRLLPPLNPVAPYLHVADLFAFPSRLEGMPNAVLEALASGLPCLLSDIAPHREIRAKNPTAAITLFPVGDAAAMAEALLQWQRSADPAGERLPGLGREFSMDAVADAYSALYRAALDEHLTSGRRSAGSRAAEGR